MTIIEQIRALPVKERVEEPEDSTASFHTFDNDDQASKWIIGRIYGGREYWLDDDKATEYWAKL